MKLQREENVTFECGIFNKIISNLKEISRTQHTSAKPPQVGGAGHVAHQTPQLDASSARACNDAPSAHTPYYETTATVPTALAFDSQQRFGILTSNRFSSFSTDEKHEDGLERKENYAPETFTSPNPKKGKK
ncbi:hypothetical protein EVAR_23377_1 [Eumeta japonica]|uniref:Uncharacterized protein n=1 Tax=Eumeta variegata TaxID=151549 RepID=A0A4C1VWZ0_EUMVA|nr:hypothetical protein EVAR_23377_1 [Eumeta japonica]